MMRASGQILARAIVAGRAAAVPGATTADVDGAVAAVIADAGAVSNFKGYGGGPGGEGAFPATICASVNDEIVHGIPGPRVLAEGDLLSIDAGCVLDGWHSDSAVSVHIGAAPDDDEIGQAETDLLVATELAMWAGIAAIKAGGRLGDVSWAIQASAERSGKQDGRRYGSVQGYGGHGIGTAMHMDPFVPNQGKRGKGVRLAPGMALAIEPMLSLGRALTRELDDGWTVSTRDGARAAHFEHSVGILSDGICVLTAADGGLAGLAPFGVTPVSLD
ncbi:type I methionyl aminopeptidase [Nakamurella sp. YIM 132087]|uniref:Methionine aminopeptidase n=2 Tax=Nakamurella alba TaxID=2665158 RepID=A0A7K1FM40_9ACTN|nr:type I methionyl aminopeptidase [Nakamurella alba]